MAVIGGRQLDGMEKDDTVGVAEQRMRRVGVDSLDRVDGSVADAPGDTLESSEHAACDGVAKGARGDIYTLFDGIGEMAGEDTILVDNDGKPYDFDDEGSWNQFLTDYAGAGEASLARREEWATARIPELLEYFAWLDTEEGQVA